MLSHSFSFMPWLFLRGQVFGFAISDAHGLMKIAIMSLIRMKSFLKILKRNLVKFLKSVRENLFWMKGQSAILPAKDFMRSMLREGREYEFYKVCLEKGIRFRRQPSLQLYRN